MLIRRKKASADFNQFEEWKRIKKEVNTVGLTKNLLLCKNKLEIRKKPTKKAKKIKQTGSFNSQHILNLEEAFGYENITKSLEFQQVRIDIRETEINRNDKLHSFDGDREGRKIK